MFMPGLDSSAKDLFLSLVDACHAVGNRDQFIDCVYPHLCRLIPHERFICGIATLKPAAVVHVVSAGFPEDYSARLIDANGAILSPLVRAWLRREIPVPVFFRTDGASEILLGERDRRWHESLVEAGIGSLAAHGLRDVGRSAMSYFCFADARLQHTHVAEMLQLIVPNLHVALMHAHHRPARHERMEALSSRETEVLEWIGRGKTNPEIAKILGISAWTVKIHVRNIMAKLDVSTRGHAVAKALRHGLVN